MTSRDFCYWLQGYFELTKIGNTNEHGQTVAARVSPEMIICIQNHLKMVFKHEIDPSMGSAHHQQELSATHSGLARLIEQSAIASVATNC